ncbi:ribonuclease [Novosphingobium marinum]|uniref:Membrane protein n=1 Tax=Novosphingobium marinum TaxID=1514948 RepID=A0A7Y9XT97_9SPHN|nr:YihY/virulence factor BrkB family protein [Novosphingobium marinum]NYH94166.1 membrane protein [Novosphingobium marinum]GGC20111.1 ribonuclease [Novosphingobium marinum]
MTTKSSRAIPEHYDQDDAEDAVSSRTTAPGATAESPWHLPWRAWIQVLKRVWIMIGFHQISLLSAGVAFFVFLAITPLIAATTLIYGLIGDPATVADQMARIVEVVPSDAAQLIEEQLIGAVTTSKGVVGLALIIALFFALFGGMRAANGMIAALNIINEERETRGIVSLTLRAASLTLAAIFIAIVGLASGGVFAWLQTQTSFLLGGGTAFLFKALTWIAAIALGSAGFALIMRYGPDRRPAKWRWLTPGSVLSTLLWILISFGFSLYVAYISDYNATYGSLSAIVVFLMWLFLSAYGVLLGALLNAEIERQIYCDTTIGPDRPAGRRGAVLADMIDASMPKEEALEKRRHRQAERARHKADEGEKL